MEHLTSPKLTIGVHCLSLRHKGMYVMSVPDPDESKFYDTGNGHRLRSRRATRPSRFLSGPERLLQALNEV